jgi:alkanesulfonate monooxygenase SsuD/methylene tetrahydromethanopterin reductase-like flavin-dependent oxidoreductase (luciferase family)
MTTATPRAEIGMCVDRTFPPPFAVELARRRDQGGVDQLWVIEDCFYTAGVSLAAAALTATERLRIGLGILPAVARNPAITAMELATLDGLAPGRLIGGIGHGLQTWMGQMGARTPSPLTTLEEVIVAVTRLLAGERVTMDGAYVHLDDVELDQPPPVPPTVLAGVRGPKSLALAGRVAGGVVLAEPAGPTYVRWALDQADRRPDDFHVAAFAALRVEADRPTAYRHMAPWLSSQLTTPHPEILTLPFFDELVARHAAGGVDALVSMPPEWWTEIGPIGTLDDAAAHVEALEAAGARSIGLFPVADVATARSQIDDVLRLADR